MVKVGSYLEDADSLVAKLKQSSVAVHGFPLAIQLFALKYIPLLLTILPNGEDQSTFLDRIIHHLPKCKSFHTSNILRLEYSSNLCVLHPQNPDPAFVASEHCDPKVKELERLIASSFQFTNDVWSGGDASLPSLTSSRKRKSIPSRSASSSSGPEDFCKQKKRVGHRSSVKIRGNADTLIEKHLKSFKASLLVELSHLIQHSHQSTRRGVPPVNKSSIVSPAVSSSPVRNTRSGCAGLSAGSFSKRSASNTRSSSSNAKHSPICHPAVGSAHTVLSPGKCLESMVDSEAVGFTGFQHLDTDVLPPEVSSPSVTGSHAHGVTGSQSISPVVLPCPVVKPLVQLILSYIKQRRPSFLHEAAKHTSHTSTLPSHLASYLSPSSPMPQVNACQLNACKPDSKEESCFIHPTPVQPSVFVLKNISQRVTRQTCSSATQCPATDGVSAMLGQVPSATGLSVVMDRCPRLPIAPPTKQLPLGGPAMNLRSKKNVSHPDVKAMIPYILSTLGTPNSATVSKFRSKLSKMGKSSYTINGHSYPSTFFTELSKPQNWVSSLHIDCIVSFLWQKHGAFLATRRITILNSMFTSMMENKFVNFSQHVNTLTYAWHPLLTAYVRGLVDGRTCKLEWLKDVDIIYLPMNWGKRHWVAIAIDLPKGHIDILDPFEDCTSARKVASYMAPIAQMLPCLLRSVCEDVPSTWPATGFTFTRMTGLAQNDRGGDYGPMSLKFIELHSYQLTSHLQELTKKTIDNIRMRYAIDLYEEYVSHV
ncbi:predicted protein [Arabidopsis lyrata subsp. lyrata]|uniref:Predicted protein n=1 Tax=Arabidopsis lyrata subsp. lyrata TaxID=81972 RepID=D7M7J5_ARALL|nr:predicted protein [Arabidopsis lyrata subsp. lyrata]